MSDSTGTTGSDRTSPGEPSPGERALGSLLDASPMMPPHELPEAVREKADLVGLTDAGLYLVDVRQVVLLPFPPAGSSVIDIDGTDAGRCFRESQVVVGDEPIDGKRLWFPLLDGTHRMGVLGAAGQPDDTRLAQGRQLAALVAEMLVARSTYGDDVVTVRRREAMTLAAEMRWALTPPLTFIGTDFSIAGYLGPAYEVAGDAFDYAVDEDVVHVGIFDAVGHGLEASRIANLAVLSYRHARRQGGDLASMHAAMHEAIITSFSHSAFATAQLATLDPEDGVLRWINAGHPPPLLVRADEPVQELEGHRVVPLGIPGATPEVNEVTLEAGDVVAFHTDGITEARDAGGEVFGAERMHRLLEEATTAGENPAETVRRLVHAAIEHQGGTAGDDATVVLVGWHRQLESGPQAP